MLCPHTRIEAWPTNSSESFAVTDFIIFTDRSVVVEVRIFIGKLKYETIPIYRENAGHILGEIDVISLASFEFFPSVGQQYHYCTATPYIHQ